jgi:NAD(P)H-dependent flavin oxidoreductase YrpB (nitropropane dioxygenase family)
MDSENKKAKLPQIIQGGMGIGVSGWRLASEVSGLGQLGVVSGVGVDSLLARRLQAGDPDKTLRFALEKFPYQQVVKRALKKYYKATGLSNNAPYRLVPRPSLDCDPLRTEFTVLANFVEVTLARHGHDGLIGINYLEKLQMTTPAAVYGAMLAGVDFILMGAGIPSEIPQLIRDFSDGKTGKIPVGIASMSDNEQAPAGESDEIHKSRVFLDPGLSFGANPKLKRPKFLAIISSNSLAGFLSRNPLTRPDGFVVESHVAGGHSARPRGRMNLDDNGEPIYGARDDTDVASLKDIGLPFWLAGGCASHESLQDALAQGASGIQVGSAFALCRESEIMPEIKKGIISGYLSGNLEVLADPEASPTGFPIKVAQLPETLGDKIVYAKRERICDVGYLRTPFLDKKGKIRYRCPAEPVEDYTEKGGKDTETKNKVCLCNGLLATVGWGQRRRNEGNEEPVVTIGKDLSFLKDIVAKYGQEYSAKDVVAYLLAKESHVTASKSEDISKTFLGISKPAMANII